MIDYKAVDAAKLRRAAYREAVTRLYPGVTLAPFASAAEDADQTGAFVEVVVFVPRSEIDPVPTVRVEQTPAPAFIADDDIPF